jgi:hypothetical protein
VTEDACLRKADPVSQSDSRGSGRHNASAVVLREAVVETEDICAVSVTISMKHSTHTQPTLDDDYEVSDGNNRGQQQSHSTALDVDDVHAVT